MDRHPVRNPRCNAVTARVTNAVRTPVSNASPDQTREVLTGDRCFRYRNWGLFLMTVDPKTTRRYAREEQRMGNELTSRNGAAEGDEPGGYELAFAVARVVAEHTDLKPHQIEELHITGDSIWILYAVHTGPRPVDVRIRTRRIDTETGTTISDHYGRAR